MVRRSKKAPHLGKGWKTIPTKSYLEVPKKARGKKGFPSYSSATGSSYHYKKKSKKKRR